MTWDYKKYFYCRQFGNPGFRLAVALIILVYSAFFADGGMDHHPTLWLSFRRIIETVVFHAIPLFLLPVMIWGTRWEKIAAWLLSFLPLANLFVYLTKLLGIG
ncbi:MAG: hypothetical protein M2R45_04717 [Verrucomicrobia subdivision 3 bacterium]|nr:hypothetical protein [Limisphaerales bacterium]MCS1416260.1 hypothetical protein [Limisphaerales bacterium]